MVVASAVRRLQRETVDHYASDVGLAPDVRYFGGARLRPLPPLDTAVGGVMFIGAYPSARLEAVGMVRDLPRPSDANDLAP